MDPADIFKFDLLGYLIVRNVLTPVCTIPAAGSTNDFPGDVGATVRSSERLISRSPTPYCSPQPR